jgi:CTP:molybdopterin cytidylyltransferase MocA
VLAAGAGRRLGGRNKALLERGGASFLAGVVATARAAGVAEIVVVVAEPFAAATAAEAARLGVAVATNPAPERGMASSVAVGFAATRAGFAADAAFLWPVDQPAIAPRTLAALIAAAGAEAAARWVVPRWMGRRGHPPLIGRALWPALAACADEDGGARAVRDRSGAAVVELEVDDPAVVEDVDQPGDLARAGDA